MKLPTIVELAKGDAEFERYQDGILWYRVWYDWHDDALGDSSGWLGSLEVPIPVSDAGGGAFEPRMKGLTLMRWIRKHLEYIREGQKEAQAPETD